MPDLGAFELFDGSAEVIATMQRHERDGPDHLVLRGRTEATVNAYHPARMRLIVDQVVVETRSTRTFRLRRADGERMPPFLAGQYISLQVELGALRTSRAFAISSSPEMRSHYDITVRRVPGGSVSNHLVDTLTSGAALDASGPVGTFFHNPLFHGEDVVFLAGGSGVAPAMSMIREIVDRRLSRRFHLVYGSRQADDVIFAEELSLHASEHPHLRVDHVISEPSDAWAGHKGYMTAALLGEILGPLRNRMVYVCGPQSLYTFALKQLGALGHARRRIRFEANGAPGRPDTRPGWPASISLDKPVAVHVEGQGRILTTAGTPLLDALEAHGIQLPAACRSGECSQCRCRLVAGEVFNPEEARLRMSDARSGYIHSCVAYPLSDIRIHL